MFATIIAAKGLSSITNMRMEMKRRYVEGGSIMKELISAIIIINVTFDREPFSATYCIPCIR